MNKVLSILLTPIFFLVFGLLLALFHPAQIIARKLFGRNAHDKVVATLNYFLSKALLILGGRIKFINFKPVPTDVPVIIVSNHQSMWDIPPIMWKFRKNHPKFIAKKSLAKNIPSISYNLKYGGSVTIDRNNSEESVEKIKQFAKYINDNKYAACIFPEGTRSRDGKIKPFKVGGIKALLTEIPNALIVPVAIKNTGKIDNSGKFLKRIGVKTSFTLLTPRKISLESIQTALDQIRLEMISVVEA